MIEGQIGDKKIDHVSGNRAYQILSHLYAGCTITGVEGDYVRWDGAPEQFCNADAQEGYYEEHEDYDPRLMGNYSPFDEV